MKNMFYLHIKYDQKLSINYHKFKDKIYTRKQKKNLPEHCLSSVNYAFEVRP